MHFTTDELRTILSNLSNSPDAKSTVALRARIDLAIAKQNLAALTKKPAKPAKEVK